MTKYIIGLRDKGAVIVSIDGQTLHPYKSQQVYNHSPSGFEWGYGGSGPCQLALAILLELYDRQTALAYYKKFKGEFIATASYNGFVISSDSIDEWLEKEKKDESSS